MEAKERVGAKLPVKTSEEQSIPKHRFDCVNLCLKETKELLRERTVEIEQLKNKITQLDKELLDAKVETVLAIKGAKNVIAVKALINFEALYENGGLSALEEQIAALKKSQSYLFEQREDAVYILVPVKGGDSLNKAIANYVKKNGG